MSQEAPDPLRSKSLTLHKGPTLLESRFRHVGLTSQLPLVKASAISLFIPHAAATLSARAGLPHLVFCPFKRPAAQSGLVHWRQTAGVRPQAGSLWRRRL